MLNETFTDFAHKAFGVDGPFDFTVAEIDWGLEWSMTRHPEMEDMSDDDLCMEIATLMWMGCDAARDHDSMMLMSPSVVEKMDQIRGDFDLKWGDE